MKTKPVGGSSGSSGGASTGGASSSSGRSGGGHSKRGSGSRERDKLKLAISGESGASSQCDTPPLTEKEGGAATPSTGRWAGLSPETVVCVAEQLGVDVNPEAAAALAEDASFKLRQVVHSVWVHSQLVRRTSVDSTDVNSVLRLMDTEPVLGANPPTWRNLGDDYCCELDIAVDTHELATARQQLSPAAPPTLSVAWVSDERALSGGDVPRALRTYCTHICRAILQGSRKAKEVALEDLATNPRIGPILPNLFNLAVLVLNDDNLNTLHVPVKEPLKLIVLDMLEALCANPCSLDTDVQKQLQRLYPAMVSDILVSGPLADKMIQVVNKLARTWPAFLHIGEKTLFEYLSAGHPERVSGAVVCCLAALGRRALLRCLEPHLDHVDACLHRPRVHTSQHIELGGALLEASWLLLRPEPDSYLEDQVAIDYTLYEMIGDAILPRRLFYFAPETTKDEKKEISEDTQDDDIVLYTPMRNTTHRPKIRVLPPRPHSAFTHRDAIFEPSAYPVVPRINIKIQGSRPRPVTHKQPIKVESYHRKCHSSGRAVAACGKLVRFTYKMPKTNIFPIFAGYTL